MEKNKPVKTLWDGNIKAAIFANHAGNGVVFNTSYARIYTDKDGSVKEAYSFSGAENLRLCELARQVHHVTNGLRREYNQRAKAQHQTQAAPQEQPGLYP